MQQAYRNRKGRTSQNVLCACDFDMRFTFVVAGWEHEDIVAEDIDQQVAQSNNVSSSSRSHDREMQVQREEIVRTM